MPVTRAAAVAKPRRPATARSFLYGPCIGAMVSATLASSRRSSFRVGVGLHFVILTQRSRFFSWRTWNVVLNPSLARYRLRNSACVFPTMTKRVSVRGLYWVSFCDRQNILERTEASHSTEFAQ